MRRFIMILMTVLLSAMLVTIASAQEKRTFFRQIRTKLFIAPDLDCDALAVVKPFPFPQYYLERLAAYVAFCLITDLSYQENPLTGVVQSPILDARIVSGVKINVTCEAGRALPISGELHEKFTFGGVEVKALNISGAVNPLATANHLATNGTWAYVASGRPNLLLEPMFKVHNFRQTPYIWHRIEGVATCITNPDGTIGDLDMDVRFTTSTRFPSHRSYWYSKNDVFLGNAGIDVQQQAFSNLWVLPPVGTP